MILNLNYYIKFYFQKKYFLILIYFCENNCFLKIVDNLLNKYFSLFLNFKDNLELKYNSKN